MGSINVINCAAKTCSYSEELNEGLGTMWVLIIEKLKQNPSDRTMLEEIFGEVSEDIESALDEGYQLEDLSKGLLFCEECKTLTSETTWICKKGKEKISSKHKCRKCKCELKKVRIELAPLENKLDTDFKVIIKKGKNRCDYKCPDCGSERFKAANMIMWD